MIKASNCNIYGKILLTTFNLLFGMLRCWVYPAIGAGEEKKKHFSSVYPLCQVLSLRRAIYLSPTSNLFIHPSITLSSHTQEIVIISPILQMKTEQRKPIIPHPRPLEQIWILNSHMFTPRPIPPKESCSA